MKRYALLAILAVAPAVAQKPATTPPAAPKMTEHQQDRLDLCISKVSEIQTRYQAQIMQESSAWVKEANDIIDAVQKANPDFIYHVAQTPQDHSGWIRKPIPEPAPSPVSPQKPAGGVLGGQGQTPQPATAPKP